MRTILKYNFTAVFVVAGLLLLAVDQKLAEDYFRTFALAMGLFIVIFSLLIIDRHLRLAATRANGARLMPAHITGIAASYLCFIVSTHVWMIDRWGLPHLWYGLPLILVGDLLGITALGIIWRFQDARKAAAGE